MAGVAFSAVFYASVGYILIPLGLFELPSVAFFYCLIVAALYRHRLHEIWTHICVWFLDILEAFQNGEVTTKAIQATTQTTLSRLSKRVAIFFTHYLPEIIVFTTAGWLRIFEGLHRWAPGQSDAYVMMKWIKLIENQNLFNPSEAELYPRGTHIFLALVRKLTALPVYAAAKFGGPMNGILIVLTVYFATVTLTKSRPAAIIAASLYGIFGTVIGGSEITRQAMTNSQEYGLVFVLGSLTFGYLYTHTGGNSYILASLASMLASFMVHPVPSLFSLSGTAVAGLVGTIGAGRSSIGRLVKLAVGAVICGLTAITPLAIGYVSGAKFHSSSQSFLTSKGATLDAVGPWFIAAIVAAVLCIVVTLFAKGKRPMFASAVTVAAVYITALFAWQSSRFGLNYEVLVYRGVNFPTLLAPIPIGCLLAWSAGMLPQQLRSRPEYIALAVPLGLALFYPISCYKGFAYFESEAAAKVNFRIIREYTTSPWSVVRHREGFSWVVGIGGHIYPEALITWYPATVPLKPRHKPVFAVDERLSSSYKYLNSRHTFGTQNVFLFVNKRPFEYTQGYSDFNWTPEETTANMAVIDRAFQQWIDIYRTEYKRKLQAARDANKKAKIAKLIQFSLYTYYEDDDLVVYRLETHQVDS